MDNANLSDESDFDGEYDDYDDDGDDEFDTNEYINTIIRNAIESGGTELNLAGHALKEVPSQIFDITTLEILELDHNKIYVIPPEIGNLSNLRSLGLEGNKLVNLPPEIGKLVKLEKLYLDKNKIETLPKEIGNLTNLVELTVGNNNLITLPIEIKYLLNLQTLYLTENEIYYLPLEIGELVNLRFLGLMNNLVAELPSDIGRLTNLQILDLTGNRYLTHLPVELSKLKNLTALFIEATSTSIPPEIAAQTSKPQTILSYYFSKFKKRLNEVKILVVGQGSVGKTSLVQQILRNIFDPNQAKTEGISIVQWKVADSERQEENSSIRVNLWDFGGQEIMHATHQFFLTRRSLYVLVLDSRLTQEENRVEYWLKIIQSFSDESPILIVGNKIDQHPLDIDRTGLQKKYPNIVGILETSAATGAGIEELKTAIAEQVNNLPHVRDLLPETWFTVKTKLEELGRESNFINQDEYIELCVENEVTDEISQRTLIGFMHDLGVVLYFQEDRRLSDLGILNPQWVTNGVYKILNSHTLFQNKGVLTTSMLDEILNLPEYPRGKRLFIVDMMKKFELCYDIEADKTFLVPDLLPKDEPAELKFNGVPAFEYAYPVLPSSVITRFIVRMNQKIEDGFVWRTGVVLKIGENHALVKADIEDRKITIAIEGVEHTRRDALSAIRYQLDEIHGSIKGLNPEKYVPVPGAPDADPLEYETLLMMEREGIETTHVKSGRKLVAVNVSQMLNGVESEYQRKQYGNVTNINIGGNANDSTIIVGDDNEVNK